MEQRAVRLLIVLFFFHGVENSVHGWRTNSNISITVTDTSSIDSTEIVRNQSSGRQRNISISALVTDGLHITTMTDSLNNEATTETVDKVPGPITWKWAPMKWPWWTIVQMVSAVLGIIGNLLVILVVFQRQSNSRSTDSLIGALAIADLLTSIFIIPIPELETGTHSVLGQLYCFLIDKAMLMWMSITVSTYTLVAISLDRFFAIVYPLTFNRIVNKRRVILAVLMVWVMSIIMCSGGFFVFKVDDATNECIYNFSSAKARLVFVVYTFVIRLVIPTTTMLITQGLIVRKLYQESKRFNRYGNNTKHSSGLLAARARVIRLTLLIVIIYIVCWGPDQLAFFALALGLLPLSYIASPLYHILIVLAFFNSCLNPFIYTALHPRFREALKSRLKGSRYAYGPVFEHKIDSDNPSAPNNTNMTSVCGKGLNINSV